MFSFSENSKQYGDQMNVYQLMKEYILHFHRGLTLPSTKEYSACMLSLANALNNFAKEFNAPLVVSWSPDE